MSWLGDFTNFAKFNLSDQWGKIKENPERPFIGAMDQGSTQVWNKLFDWTAPITGIQRHYQPLTDYWGGAPADTYAKANAQGINTAPFHSGQNVANTIASLYAGGYGAGQLGAGAGAGEGAGGAFTPTEGSSFTIDPNATYTTAYPSAGSSVVGSQAPYAGDQQYMNQDVMQQARDTSAASGSSQAWDTGSQSGGGLSAMQKQLLANSLMNMGGQKQPQQQPPLQIYKEQPAFLGQPQALPIQDELQNQKLAMALRNQYGY